MTAEWPSFQSSELRQLPAGPELRAEAHATARITLPTFSTISPI
jgi:hypothetical protein